MVDETTTTESNNTLRDELANLWTKFGTVSKSQDLKAISAVTNEIRAVERKISESGALAEKSARDAACVTAAKALGNWGADLAKLGATIEGVYRRDDDGKFTDLSIKVTVGDNVSADFHKAFPIDAFVPLKSVKGIKFTRGPDGIKVEPTGRQPGSGSGGGGGGKGWSKNGTQYKLGEVFDAEASSEEVAELASLDGDPQYGNKSYALRRKVAIAAKYTQNGD